MATRGYRTIRLQLAKRTQASVYTSPRLAAALEEMVSKASLYEGVKLAQILEAVYLQGKKDGAREAFEQLDQSIAGVKKQIPHKNPGRPPKKVITARRK